MEQKSFLLELQRIQCNLASGIKVLGQVETMLSEEALPNHYSDMLFVVYTFMKDVRNELTQCVQAYEQRHIM